MTVHLRLSALPAVAVLAAIGVAACAGNLKPGAFTSRSEMVKDANTDVSLTLVKPDSSNPPPFVVVFASGDGGLRGGSMAVLQHLADQRYWVAAFSSPDAFEEAIKRSGNRPNYLATRAAFAALLEAAKKGLGLPDGTPVIMTGMSRGANVVIASAGDPTLNPGFIGAIAIALTREFDDLTVPRAADLPGIELDDKGRIRTGPAISRLGSLPLAIIQSTNDSYETAAQWRRLLGPDTPTRRLYEVESKGHTFGGGQDVMLRDLDDAIKWIAAFRPLASPKLGDLGQ